MATLKIVGAVEDHTRRCKTGAYEAGSEEGFEQHSDG